MCYNLGMLTERTAIVTGGARGIGFAIAKELSGQGARVVLCSRTESEVSRAIDELATLGANAYGLVIDVSRFADCQKLIDFAHSQTGRIDILVNNAGIYGPIGLFEINDPEEWRKVLEINVLGAVHCSLLAIPFMKKQGGGKIINLAGAGVGGSKAMPRISAYYTSKAAIASFTEALATELEEHNIQVNAIAPGAVASELNLKLLKMERNVLGEELYKMAKQLEKDGGTPPELAAKLIAFLVADRANHITGRLLSAKWDPIDELEKPEGFTQNKYRLRRVDDRTILEKK